MSLTFKVNLFASGLLSFPFEYYHHLSFRFVYDLEDKCILLLFLFSLLAGVSLFFVHATSKTNAALSFLSRGYHRDTPEGPSALVQTTHIQDQRVHTHLLEYQSDSRKAGVRAIDLHYISQIVFVGNNVECVRNSATNDPILN